ncbi:MAG: DUF4465 domain-containing protein, partial [Planctomycetales bacterium]
MRPKQVGMLLLLLAAPNFALADTIDFEDLSLSTGTFYNGSDGAGGFGSQGAAFNNFYDDAFGPYWEGFAYSNTTDVANAGFGNQYSAYSGGGDGSPNYGVAFTGGG